MGIISRLGRWVWRAWPFVAIVLIGIFHYIFIGALSFNAQTTNETISFITQISGGLLVLYSIDSTLGIVSGSSLSKGLVQYFKEFPLIKRKVVTAVGGGSISLVGGKVRMRVGRNPGTIEGKLEYLQEQIDELRQHVKEDIDEVRELVNDKAEKITDRVSSIEGSLTKIDQTVKDVSVGGVKAQIMGVLLLLYGAVIAYAF